MSEICSYQTRYINTQQDKVHQIVSKQGKFIEEINYNACYKTFIVCKMDRINNISEKRPYSNKHE